VLPFVLFQTKTIIPSKGCRFSAHPPSFIQMGTPMFDVSHTVTPLDYLASLEFFGIKLGLDRIRELLHAAENPQRNYPVVHVAGTNGKGSVLAFLAAILRSAGVATGRFTSPHLLDVRERFLVDSTPIPEAGLREHIEFFRAVAAAFDAPPTYFELCTAVALRHFAKTRVDVALIETGMGGRLDSTNIVIPEAVAITSIGLDHTRYLGETLDAIAGEKAGIIKQGIPVVSGETNPVPLRVIAETAKANNAPLLLLDRDFSASATGPVWTQRFSYDGPAWRLENTPLGLAGRHQVTNAAVAVTLAGLLRERFPRLDEQAVKQGLAETVWPCRLECVPTSPPIILDAAHNPPGILRLAEALEGRYVIILAVSSDKDAASMMEILAQRADPLILTTFNNTRSRDLDSLAVLAGNIPHRRVAGIAGALEEGFALAMPEKPLVLCGSIFAVAEARGILTEKYGAPPLCF
jgi:dihydrofolate synthase / folylpolyglutamate synthase